MFEDTVISNVCEPQAQLILFNNPLDFFSVIIQQY